MHKENILIRGKELQDAEKALIMIHGRGASAEDILSITGYLNVKDYTLLAPQATNHTWYPQSFLAPPAQNEPWLSSALELIAKTVDRVVAAGIASENIRFLGFSQGACLMLEFIARHAMKYGGAVAFTGGLIGDRLYKENYRGDFNGMPVFLGSSNPDFHVPVQRVHDTTGILKRMGADVTEKIYDNMGHTIIQEEINLANQLVFS
ncbi:MAG TPA: dienelactone hydrolase family protein [Chitinophaga sp.]|uniref:alpha/beta hydrolase n=1 Tax=Chitinophaga sp. TaxID=1869181 RepID=UPI002C08BBCB|nr:dienelactone hydrolase family protein [Chitinophaga sp.]HVI47319.1 dienelactone hydrolase family protein [Chitinophaga sp.]